VLHSIIEFYRTHPAFTGAVIMALANAIITTMPSPRANGSQFYAWAFNFLHSAVGAISRIAAQYRAGGGSGNSNGNGNAPEAP
jgi:hypothetical protein